jgi:hypothetical protein
MAPAVETNVRPALERRGLRLSSSWHAGPLQDPDLTRLPPRALQEIADKNDRDIAESNAMLLLYETACRETLCELRYALVLEIPVVLVSHGETLPLSAYRDGVTRVRNLSEAVDVLAGWARGARALAVTLDGGAE